MNIIYLISLLIIYLINNYLLISLLQHSYYSLNRIRLRFTDQFKYYPYLGIIMIIVQVVLLPIGYFYPNYLLCTILGPVLLIIFTPKIKLKVTYRAIRLLITNLILDLSLLLTTYFILTKFLFICSFTIFFVFLILILSYLMLQIYEIPRKNYCFKKAKRKLEENENLIVIGITGSYGKTTIKNFITQLLSPKDVLKSPGNINTPLGLANFIRKNLTLFDRVLIVELGVDSKGGMKVFKKFLTLDYTVIVSLGNQHLRTFKTFENIKREKENIVSLIKPGGMLIYNEDDIKIFKRREDIFYTPCSKKDYLTIYQDKNISLINYNSSILKIPFVTQSLIFDSFLSYMIVTKFSSSSLILLNLSSLSLPSRRKRIYKQGELTIIDDSYNLNLKGLKEAIKTMKKYSEPYYIMTGGIKETNSNIAMLYSFFSYINEADVIYYTSKISKIEKGIINTLPGLKSKLKFIKKPKMPTKGCLLILTMGDNSSLL